jgi:glycosyltransferase involved in cell wall biosynthesis
MYGSGPLEAEIAARAPSNVTVAGWVPRDEIWKDARAYLGTSTREAFGRSAVEAAMLGIPVVLSDSFGCAEMLYSDPELKRLFVLPITAPEAWREAVQLLTRDDTLHTRVSRHLQMNARRLTIESAVSNVAKAADDVVRSTSSTGSSTGHTKRGTGG